MPTDKKINIISDENLENVTGGVGQYAGLINIMNERNKDDEEEGGAKNKIETNIEI